MQSSPALFLLVPLALSGCNKLLTKQAGAAPSAGPSIELFVPANARHIGVAMPVQLSVAVPQAEAGSPGQAACVALAGGPGTVRPIFPAPCLGSPTLATDAGVRGSLSNPAWTCFALRAAGGISAGSTLAIYTPQGEEEIVTLAGALYADPSCSGAPIASAAVTIDLLAQTVEAGAPDADAALDGPSFDGERTDGADDLSGYPDGGYGP